MFKRELDDFEQEIKNKNEEELEKKLVNLGKVGIIKFVDENANVGIMVGIAMLVIELMQKVIQSFVGWIFNEGPFIGKIHLAIEKINQRER